MWSLGCILAEMITGMIAVDSNFRDNNISNTALSNMNTNPLL